MAWALDEVRGGTASSHVGWSATRWAAGPPCWPAAVRACAAWSRSTPGSTPDDHADLAGRRVLFVHGADDRVADPARSAAVARRIAATTDVGFVSVPGARHAMLRHGSLFERAAADFCLATLLDPPPARATGVVARVLDGEQRVSAG